MEFKMEWIRPVVFGLLAVWVFSFMLWDFILAVIKTWERVRSDQANIFDLKLETQFFVGGCVLIAWGLHYFIYIAPSKSQTWQSCFLAADRFWFLYGSTAP